MIEAFTTNVLKIIPSSMRDTALIRILGFTKIPLLWFISPVVTQMDNEKCIVKVPLKRKTKNHLGSMYFGVLAAGADCAGGLFAMKHILNSKQKVSLSFKEFNAKFLKRAEGDTYFTCTQGAEVEKFVQMVLSQDERAEMPIEIVATCPDKLGDEPVATFTLVLSLKKQ
jgi:acyl-coenzyme A thioesterase PaaI-like protein